MLVRALRVYSVPAASVNLFVLMNYVYCVVSNAGNDIDIHVNRLVMKNMSHLAPGGVDACGRCLFLFDERKHFHTHVQVERKVLAMMPRCFNIRKATIYVARSGCTENRYINSTLSSVCKNFCSTSNSWWDATHLSGDPLRISWRLAISSSNIYLVRDNPAFSGLEFNGCEGLWPYYYSKA